jgi:hypothetical protein
MCIQKRMKKSRLLVMRITNDPSKKTQIVSVVPMNRNLSPARKLTLEPEARTRGQFHSSL